MTNVLTLKRWRPGIQVVSLIQLVRVHSGLSLTESKVSVERLLAGSPVTLSFPSPSALSEFRVSAEQLGVETE